MNYPSKIFLVGMPGSGKTTLGQHIARELKRNFFDLDEEIERMAGWVIKDIFAKVGEDYFRELERSVLEMLIKLNEPSIISTGGGAPCFYENMELMNESGATIFLDVAMDALVLRVSEDRSVRPIINEMAEHSVKEEMEALYKKRLPQYEKASFTTNSNLPEIMKFLESTKS